MALKDNQADTIKTVNVSEVTSTDRNDTDIWAHFDEKVSNTTTAITPDTSTNLIVKQYLEILILDRTTHFQKHQFP